MSHIVIACDHAGYALKEQVKKHLEEMKYEVLDMGPFSDEPVAYPEYASKLCRQIQEGNAEKGILICGTGIGMSMAANKHKGIRAACVSDTFSAKATRKHNDANVLCFGARVVGMGLAFELVDAFLSTEYEGGRHQSRIDMLTALDNK